MTEEAEGAEAPSSTNITSQITLQQDQDAAGAEVAKTLVLRYASNPGFGKALGQYYKDKLQVQLQKKDVVDLWRPFELTDWNAVLKGEKRSSCIYLRTGLLQKNVFATVLASSLTELFISTPRRTGTCSCLCGIQSSSHH